MRSRVLVGIVISLCLLCIARGAATAEQPKPAVEILSPQDGAVVAAVDDLRGRLRGRGFPIVLVRPLPDAGQQPWYVQPPIESLDKGEFSAQVFFGDASTKPGTRFRVAVLVVPSREDADHHFKRGTTLDSLPPELQRSPFVTVSRDVPAGPRSRFEPQDRLITFAGWPWAVKCGQGVGPGPNTFSDVQENVQVDNDGQLHLVIKRRGDRWLCAELIGPPLGYGEYRWIVTGTPANLDPDAVLGLFLYAHPDEGRREREADFELSHWGDPRKPNAQFVVQPFAVEEMRRFDTGKAEVITVSLTWDNGMVRGRCWDGEDRSRKPLADWRYSGSKVPLPKEVRVRMNLWLLDGRPPMNKRSQEVTVRSFHFEPAGHGAAP